MTDPEQAQPVPPTGASREDRGRECVGPYLTIEQLSAATTLSVSTLRRLRKRGVIVAHQPGGPRHRVVFPPDAIEKAADSRTPSAAAPNAPPPRGTTRPRRGPQPKWLGGT